MDTKVLTVPGTLGSLSAVADFVMRVAAEAGLDKHASYRLRLAVDEIVTNIVVHGYSEPHARGDITLTSEVDGDELTIYIEDCGEECDPRTVPVPDLYLPPEQRPIGGLGVYLALRNVDKFDYQRRPGGNRNVLTMYLPTSLKDE